MQSVRSRACPGHVAHLFRETRRVELECDTIEEQQTLWWGGNPYYATPERIIRADLDRHTATIAPFDAPLRSLRHCSGRCAGREPTLIGTAGMRVLVETSPHSRQTADQLRRGNAVGQVGAVVC